MGDEFGKDKLKRKNGIKLWKGLQPLPTMVFLIANRDQTIIFLKLYNDIMMRVYVFVLYEIFCWEKEVVVFMFWSVVSRVLWRK